MIENARDAGLVRTVGPWGLAANIVNTIVGAGIFAVPAALAASIGVYAPLAFLVCAIAIGAVAICFAEGGSRLPTSGGAYGYIQAALGPLVGYIAGTLLWFSDVLACGGVTAALADMAASLLPPAFVAPARVLIIVFVIGGVTLVNLRGVAQGARLINGATVLKLMPLAIFVAVGVSAIHASNFAAIAVPDPHGLGRALILALFAFTGMEVGLTASGEVAQPARTIPLALGIAITSIAFLYIAIQIVAQGILGTSLALSTVPLADAMARIHPALRILLLSGAALSMFGFVGSDILGTPRIVFAFARDGLLPRVLGRVHPRSHVPYVAILGYATLAMAFALTGTFAQLAVLATLATAPIYVLGCVAAWRLARQGVALAGTPLNFRGLSAAMVVGAGSMLVLIALGTAMEILGLLAVIGAAAVGYLAHRPRR